MTVYKVDGIGTRKDGSGGEVANFSEGNKRFIRIGMYRDKDLSALVAEKGNVVSIEVNTGSPHEILINGAAVNAADYIGLGNMVKIADHGTALDEAYCIGVLAEDVSIAAGEYKFVSVQVSGVATVHTDGNATKGAYLVLDASQAGCLTDTAADASDTHAVLAIALADDAADTSFASSQFSCSAILLNPFSL
tara:strand:+ start:16784 stop:17359 length:576 start_codon:yes stop_codon:yes gene_type:complete